MSGNRWLNIIQGIYDRNGTLDVTLRYQGEIARLTVFSRPTITSDVFSFRTTTTPDRVVHVDAELIISVAEDVPESSRRRVTSHDQRSQHPDQPGIIVHY